MTPIFTLGFEIASGFKIALPLGFEIGYYKRRPKAEKAHNLPGAFEKSSTQMHLLLFTGFVPCELDISG